MKKLLRCAVPLVMAATGGVASADSIVWNGEVIEGNSWSTGFTISGAGIDFIGVRMNSVGDAFEGPVFHGIDLAGWDNFGDYGVFPTIAAAAGPDLAAGDLFNFDVRFEGDATNSLNFDFVLFDGATIRGIFNANWNGTVFSIPFAGVTYDLDLEDFTTTVVPLPSAAGLAGVGLIALGARRRRVGS